MNSTVIQEDSQKLGNINELLSLISEFGDKYRKEKEALQYPINLIDLLHADENAHSRILAKLLQYRTKEGSPEILKSFICFLSEKAEAFRNIINKVEDPEITHGRGYIDIWIKDKKNYAIIIENKIHSAKDQDCQLENYIKKTRTEFLEEKIFIIYLPPTEDKNPEKQSWGRLEKKYKDRYLKLTFKDDILIWLNDKVLPIIKKDEKLLLSTVEQYADYLQYVELKKNARNNIQRKIYNPIKKMNNKLDSFIIEKLELEGVTPQEVAQRITIINERLPELKNCAEETIFLQWQKNLKEKYPEYELIEGKKEAGLIIPVEDMKIRVFISNQHNNKEKELYCQVDTHRCNNRRKNLPEKLSKTKLSELLTEQDTDDKTLIWELFEYSKYENVYNSAYETILDIISILIKMK